MLHPFHFFRPVLRAQTVSGAHHDGCRAARNLYGVIIAPVVLITAGGQAPGPFETAIVLSVTVGVVLGMETYTEVIAREITFAVRWPTWNALQRSATSWW